MQTGDGKKKSTEAEVNENGDGMQSPSTQVVHGTHESAGEESHRQSHNH